MSTDEIKELLELKGWDKMDLAGELGVTENAIYKWLSGKFKPSKLASRFMRDWLAEARAANGRKKVGAK